MKNNKLGKAKNSINQLDANKSNSGVSNTEMSIMYNMSNVTNSNTDANLEQEKIKE